MSAVVPTIANLAYVAAAAVAAVVC
jgi:hypothetical protein